MLELLVLCQMEVFTGPSGEYQGSYSRSRDGSAVYQDQSGRYSGQSRSDGNSTIFQDQYGRYQGSTTGNQPVRPLPPRR